MRFEWDPDKAERNRLLHGIVFEDATRIFDGPRPTDFSPKGDP